MFDGSVSASAPMKSSYRTFMIVIGIVLCLLTVCMVVLFAVRPLAADHAYIVSVKNTVDGRLGVERIRTNQGWRGIAMATCSKKYLANRYARSRNINVFALIVDHENGGVVEFATIDRQLNEPK